MVTETGQILPRTDRDAVVAGSQTSRLKLLKVTPADSGVYAVAITDELKSARSFSVTVNVQPLARPSISADPSFEVPEERTVILTAQVTDTRQVAFEWRWNGAVVPNETGPTLTLPNVRRANAGIYTVTVRAAGLESTSGGFALRVLAPVIPPETNPKPLQALAPSNGVDRILVNHFPANGLRPLAVEISTNLVNWFAITNRAPFLGAWLVEVRTNVTTRYYRAVEPLWLNTSRLSPGQPRFQAFGLWRQEVILEASEDLQHWNAVTNWSSGRNNLFDDFFEPRTGASQQFYRLKTPN
jgi:hypothetical protein